MGTDNVRDFRRLRLNSPAPPEPRTATITELINDCRVGADRMGKGNPNRLLLINCARALEMLCERLGAIEKPAEPILLDSAPIPVPDPIPGEAAHGK